MVSFRKCQLAERTSVASLTSRPVTSKSSARILLLCQGASPVAHALLHSSPEGGHWLRSSGSGLTVVEHSYEKTQDAHDHCRRRAGCGSRGPGPVLRKRPRGARWARGRRWDAGRPDRAPTGLLHHRARRIRRSRRARGRARPTLQPRQLRRLPLPTGHRRDEPRSESSGRGRHGLRRAQHGALVHHPQRAGAGSPLQVHAKRHP